MNINTLTDEQLTKELLFLFWVFLSVLFLGCFSASAQDFRGVVVCGGGYTDKYGVTWSFSCPNGAECKEKNCCYYPWICKDCSSSVPLDPPEIQKRCFAWDGESVLL